MPETLEMDTRRLAEAQAAFQRLLVGVAATLLLREHAAASRKPLPPGKDPTVPNLWCLHDSSCWSAWWRCCCCASMRLQAGKFCRSS